MHVSDFNSIQNCGKDKRHIRTDIQLLRAFAVLLVLFFHAGIPGIMGGFLGVDIFLVISGYLITRHLLKSITEGNFSFADFYLRRAKRLLPASYAVYLTTAIAGAWFLNADEYQRFLDTLLGALTFTANFDLWQSTNYFNNDAKLNVLLHTWSLSLEEQFYLILPICMLAIPIRFLTKFALIFFFASFSLCLIVSESMPAATFYLLPTRAWELLIGTVLALSEYRLKHELPNWVLRIWPAALAVLLLVPTFMPFAVMGNHHPGIDALLVTLATAIIILCRPLQLNAHSRFSQIGARLGDISYSLYLVHWPLFALFKNAYIGGEIPWPVSLLLIACSFGLAIILHRYIEHPFSKQRIGGNQWQWLMGLLAATLFVWFTAVYLESTRNNVRDYSTLSQFNHGLSKECDSAGSFTPLKNCTTTRFPETILWGDSYAMHVAEILRNREGGLLQATKSGCAPAIGIAHIASDVGQGRAWAEDCIKFNRDVHRFLLETDTIKTVVLASLFDQILGTREIGVVEEGNQLKVKQLTFEYGLSRYIKTVQQLVNQGLDVVIVGPTPSVGLNFMACIERKESSLLIFGPFSDCEFSRAAAGEFRALTVRAISELRDVVGVRFVNFFDIFCDELTCKAEIDDILLFRDSGHISNAGAHYIRNNSLFNSLVFPDEHR